MNIVRVDASGWKGRLDFYEGLLSGLRAPKWHGWSVNALIDSMIYGEINEVDQPVHVDFHGLDGASPDARKELRNAFDGRVSEGAICRISNDGTASLEVVWPLSRGRLDLAPEREKPE